MTTLRLPVRGPFSLAASTRLLEGFAPARYRGSPDGGPLRLVFPVEGSGGTVGVTVRQDADGGVLADVGPVLPDWVATQLARILSLDVDGSAFPTVAAADPVVAELAERYPGLRPVCFFSPYEAACWAVLPALEHGRGGGGEGAHRPAVRSGMPRRRRPALGVPGARPAACRRRRAPGAGGQAGSAAGARRGCSRRAAGRRSPAIPPGREGPGRGSGAPRHGAVLRGAGGGARGRCSRRLSGERGAPACRHGRALRARRSVRPDARRHRRGMGAVPELGLVAHPCRPRRPGRGGGRPSQAVGLGRLSRLTRAAEGPVGWRRSRLPAAPPTGACSRAPRRRRPSAPRSGPALPRRPHPRAPSPLP